MRILVLCHGNYMRSPAAAAVLRSLGYEHVTSAGFHPRAKVAAGRMRRAMAARGYDLDSHVPQQVTREMLLRHDLILYMDRGNEKRLRAMCDGHLPSTAVCLGAYVSQPRIPDPAFIPSSEQDRFEQVVDLIIAACRGLLATDLENRNK